MSSSRVVKLSLGLKLRSLRVAAGKTAEDVATAGVGKRGKLHLIETGKISVRVPDLETLFRLYDVDGATRSQLLEMAQAAHEGGWWERYGDALPQWFSTYVELESAASDLWVYHGELVPGLLQTPGYQASLFKPDTDRAYVTKQLEVRAERQKQAWERPKPLQMVAILGHGVLSRALGDEKVMTEQFEHLLRMSERPNVDILVVPPDAPYHPGMKSCFYVLQWDMDIPHLVYQEGLLGGRYEDAPRATELAREGFAAIRSYAVTLREYTR